MGVSIYTVKTIFLSFINFIAPKLIFEKIYRYLYIKNHNIYVRIKNPEYKFLYRSPIFDDLNMMSRENLEFWEHNSREIFSLIAKQSTVIFDVGAYTGIYTLISGKANSKAKIYSFEPNPLLFEALKKNVKINRISKRCILVNSALSNSTEERFLFQNAEFHTSQFSLNEYTKDSKKIKVSTIELDIFSEEQNLENLDLMKIDAEGFEENIIFGGLKTLAKFHPIILMEALTDKELNIQKELLKDIGYTSLFRIKGNEFDSRNYLWVSANSDRSETLEKVLAGDKLLTLNI
jgi:FkbM family methyltransferase